MPWPLAVMPWLLAGMLDVGAASAQSLPPLDEYKVQVYGPEDGLPAADVRGIEQSPEGLLYLAMAKGLFSFNGYEFEPIALPGLRSEFLTYLHTDRRGRLWILSDDRDLGYLEEGRFHLLPTLPVKGTRIDETSDGAIWVSGYQDLVRVALSRASTFTHYTTPFTLFTPADGLPTTGADGVCELPGGERIVATDRSLLRIESGRGREAAIHLARFGPDLRLISGRMDCSDADGLLLLMQDHLLRYRGGEFTRFGKGTAEFDRLRRKEDRLVVHMRGRDGTHWLAFRDADQNTVVLHEADGVTRRIPLRRHLTFRTIWQIFEDHEGNVWLSTNRGLVKLTPRIVLALTERQGLTESFTVAVRQTRDGSVWVGSWGGGVHQFTDGRMARRFARADGLPDNRIRALYETRAGDLWIGTYDGFARLRDGRIGFSRTTGQPIRAFGNTPDGRLWAGGRQLLLVGDGATFTEYRPDIFHHQSIWTMHSAADALWIGTEAGLFRVSADSLRRFDERDGLRSTFITAIHPDEDGSLWIGTFSGGLHRYRGGRFVPVTKEEGLYSNGVWSMVEDGGGGVWMSSDEGVFRVDLQQLHAVADAVERGEPPRTPLTPLVFTEAEGMPNRESNRGFSGGWRLRDGRLVFNNVAGLVVVDPSRVTARPPPAARVTAVAVDGQDAGRDGFGGQIPAGTRQIAFEFAALSYAAPEQNRYRYRLDGYDDHWIASGTRDQAAYTNLRPGRYTFRVQGAGGIGAWGEPGAAVPFRIAPLVWESWWFRLAVIGLILGTLALAYRFRVRHLLAMQSLRLRIASDLHDDVGSSLSSIALLSDMLGGHTRLGGLERRQLSRIHDAAEETVGALRDIIWLVDPKHDDLVALVRRMRAVAGDLLNGTEYTFRVPDPLDSHPLGMTLMRNVFLIGKEALHNAAKHARGNRVTIEVGTESGVLRLRIEDDGPGFVLADDHQGRGLRSMRRRALEMGGELEIESSPGRGTILTLSVPMA